MRTPILPLVALGALTLACSDTAPTAPGSDLALAAGLTPLLSPPLQGACGAPAVYPLMEQRTGTTRGMLTFYGDDYNGYTRYVATGEASLLRTSTEYYEGGGEMTLPVTPAGILDVDLFRMQTRHAPTAATTTVFLPLQLVNDDILSVNVVPRAVVTVGPTYRSAWAGDGPGFMYDDGATFVIDDPNARHFNYRLQSCGPRALVFNDINVFDDAGMSNPDNQRMIENLVGYLGDRGGKYPVGLPRFRAGGVMFDRGRDAPCWATGECSDAALSTLRALLGGSITSVLSTSGTLTSFPPDIELLFLWNPRTTYTVSEINALKQFAAEGGRIIFIGEHAVYYGTRGITTENRFLADMGSTARTIGGAIDCGYNDVALGDIPRHYITGGDYYIPVPTVDVLRQACAAALVPSISDFLLYYDQSGAQLLGASVALNTSPITDHLPWPATAVTATPTGILATSTGR